jgi:hypothetical protein
MAAWRAHLAPPLVDGLWAPRYDVDEEALLEAEEADLLYALRLVRKAGAVAYIGSRGGKRRRGQEEEREEREGAAGDGVRVGVRVGPGGGPGGPGGPGGGPGGGSTTEEEEEEESAAGGGSDDSVSSIASDDDDDVMSFDSDASGASSVSAVSM